jgi:3-methyladenine DNA glycosylase Mpg
MRYARLENLPEHMRAHAAVQLAQQLPAGATPAAKAGKYRNQALVVDGERFASKLEYACHVGQLARWKSGVVLFTLRQVCFRFRCGTTYRCDNFNSLAAGGVEVIDAKGVLTKEFQIKARLMKAEYGLEVLLWTRKGMRPFSERRGSSRRKSTSSPSTPGATGAGA